MKLFQFQVDTLKNLSATQLSMEIISLIDQYEHHFVSIILRQTILSKKWSNF